MSAAEWRCCVCNKVKDLRGDHLKGKTNVRSDCWPCAKKQSFRLVDPNATAIGTGESAPPFLFAAGQKQLSQPPPSTVAAKPNPFSSHSSSAPLQRSVSPSNNWVPFSFGNAKAGNPFLTPFSTTGGTSGAGIAMQQTKCAPNPSPPFTFVAKTSSVAQPPVFSLGAATSGTVAPVMVTSSAATGEECWRCSVCKKVKDLRGDHLKNKNIVRSDCWPCARKQSFIRHDGEGRPLAVVAPSNKSVPQIVVVTPHSGRTSVSPSSAHISLLSGNFTSPREPLSTTDTLHTSSSFDAHATPILPTNFPVRSAFNWRDPDIPTEATEQSFFMAAEHKEANGEISLTSAFYEKTIKYYLSLHRSKRFQRDMPLLWSDAGRTLYVCCTFLSSRLPNIEEALGEYASVLVYLESVCPDPISRIFCSDALSFAAMSLYKQHLNSDCFVYGPQKDMTTTASVLDSIVSLLSQSSAIVTSGEQRVEASKSIWLRTGLSVLPAAAIAEALRLYKSSTDPASPNSRSGVDIVLIPRVVALDEFTQFRNVIA